MFVIFIVYKNIYENYLEFSIFFLIFVVENREFIWK